jgi:uncharacterized membrane protein
MTPEQHGEQLRNRPHIGTVLEALAERRRKHPPRNVNAEFEASFTPLDHVALAITNVVGTFGFFLIIAAWSVLWLGWNTIGPEEKRFDPAPAFVLWLFISNLIQLMLLPLLLVGQNLQGRHSELRAQNDFEINQKAEQEVETILMALAKQEARELEILQRLDALATAKSNPPLTGSSSVDSRDSSRGDGAG